MNKLLSIVGPTATGKTSTALTLAKKLFDKKLVSGIDIISADSRQIYQGLEILTGADIPVGFARKESNADSVLPYDYFANSDDSIRIYGISIIKPTEEWSVAHFQIMARSIISASWKTHRLPILVGGTGLYHDQLFIDDQQLHVGPDPKVRHKAEKMTVIELQHWLNKLSNQRFEQMNHSDQFNPRRLIRAIEIFLARVKNTQLLPTSTAQLTLALASPLEIIETKINQRVNSRFELGALNEVKALFDQKTDSTFPVFSTLGVKELSAFISGEINQEDCQKLWSLHEFQYAKRQLTWWRHKRDLIWFDLTTQSWRLKVFQVVKSWLTSETEVT